MFSVEMNTTLQKGKVALNQMHIPRLIKTLTPIILGLGRIPSMLNGPICLFEGSQGMDFKLPSDF